jgi:Tol biopolymer transport system component
MRAYAPAKPWAETAGGALGAGWTRDGKYYLFESRDEHGTSIWTMQEGQDLFHPVARRPVQIYALPTEAGRLVPSPDGKKLFFLLGHESRDLLSYDGRRGQFLPFLGGISARRVSFSADGQWVAYVTIPEEMLWRSRANGAERLQLSSYPLFPGEPRWSPDGRRIAFGAGLPGSDRTQIYLVSSQGGKPEKLSTEPCYNASFPSWSPDGFAMVFECLMQGQPGEQTSLRSLDLHTAHTAPLVGSEGCWRPSWSPDGRYIAAVRLGIEVVLYDFSSGQWRRLRNPVPNATYARQLWARNSRWLYFQQQTGDEEQPIFRADVLTGTVVRMMSARQIPQSGVSAYYFTGMTPQDAPIAAVLRRTADVYALDVDLP